MAGPNPFKFAKKSSPAGHSAHRNRYIFEKVVDFHMDENREEVRPCSKKGHGDGGNRPRPEGEASGSPPEGGVRIREGPVGADSCQLRLSPPSSTPFVDPPLRPPLRPPPRLQFSIQASGPEKSTSRGDEARHESAQRLLSRSRKENEAVEERGSGREGRCGARAVRSRRHRTHECRGFDASPANTRCCSEDGRRQVCAAGSPAWRHIQ